MTGVRYDSPIAGRIAAREQLEADHAVVANSANFTGRTVRRFEYERHNRSRRKIDMLWLATLFVKYFARRHLHGDQCRHDPIELGRLNRCQDPICARRWQLPYRYGAREDWRTI